MHNNVISSKWVAGLILNTGVITLLSDHMLLLAIALDIASYFQCSCITNLNTLLSEQSPGSLINLCHKPLEFFIVRINSFIFTWYVVCWIVVLAFAEAVALHLQLE